MVHKLKRWNVLEWFKNDIERFRRLKEKNKEEQTQSQGEQRDVIEGVV